MMPRRVVDCRPCVSVAFFALAVLAGASGGGCSGAVTPGSRATDGGGGGPDTGTGSCTPADCAGLPAPQLAIMCPDGTSVGATLCARQADGQCSWTVPPCPPEDGGHACPALGCFPNCPNGVLKDVNGCDTCQCAPTSDAGTCTTNADCPNGGICGFLESAGCAATGQCFAASPGPRCAIPSSIGCGCNGTEASIDPSCYSGLPNGYQTKPILHEGACSTVDAGGCVSQPGGPCGGNTAHPCTCASGLSCTPGDSGLPFGDVGGTCE